MSKKMQHFIRVLSLSFYLVCLLAPAVSYWGYKARILKASQTITVPQGQELSTAQPNQSKPKKKTIARKLPPQMVQSKLLAARNWADRLDAQTMEILNVSTQSGVHRWMKGQSLEKLEKQYSQDTVEHLRAMTDVMRTRRELGGFHKLREFDFTNVMRRSDFILSLELTRNSLRSLSKDKYMWQKLQETVASYNQERRLLDKSYIEI